MCHYKFTILEDILFTYLFDVFTKKIRTKISSSITISFSSSFLSQIKSYITLQCPPAVLRPDPARPPLSRSTRVRVHSRTGHWLAAVHACVRCGVVGASVNIGSYTCD